MRNVTKGVLVVLAVLSMSITAAAASYDVLVPWSTLEAGSGGTTHFGAVVAGNTSFHQLRSGAAITRVDDLGGAQTSSVLMDSTAWFGATGETSLSTWYGFGVSGDHVQFADTTTDAIWRVHADLGTVTPYATSGDITTLTGETSSQCLSPSDTTPSGEMAFYEGRSDSILITTGLNGVEYLITSAELTAATGSDSVSGGLSFDAAGNLYWGSNSSDDLWRRATDGSLGQVLSTAEITAVTGEGAVGWKDIFAAPDGLVYFQDNTSDHILRFDPSDAAGSLEIFLSSDDLLNGPMGSNNAISLTWFDGNLAWHAFNETPLYYVPEPTSLLLCVLGGLILRRR